MSRYRTLVRGHLSNDGGDKVMEAVIPAWNPEVTVRIPKDRLPSFVWVALVTGSKYFYARVNLDTEDAEGKNDYLDWLEPASWEVGEKQTECPVELEIGRYYLNRSSRTFEQYVGYDPYAKDGPRWGFRRTVNDGRLHINTWLLEHQLVWMELDKNVCPECYNIMAESMK